MSDWTVIEPRDRRASDSDEAHAKAVALRAFYEALELQIEDSHNWRIPPAEEFYRRPVEAALLAYREELAINAVRNVSLRALEGLVDEKRGGR